MRAETPNPATRRAPRRPFAILPAGNAAALDRSAAVDTITVAAPRDAR
jgi:hypothetical protein